MHSGQHLAQLRNSSGQFRIRLPTPNVTRFPPRTPIHSLSGQVDGALGKMFEGRGGLRFAGTQDTAPVNILYYSFFHI